LPRARASVSFMTGGASGAAAPGKDGKTAAGKAAFKKGDRWVGGGPLGHVGPLFVSLFLSLPSLPLLSVCLGVGHMEHSRL
jgi:hypothetical protein